jgi:catechol 2,3-dioxygenase-like lactoylglutathione lyase family enzyme
MTEQLVPIFRVANARASAKWYARLGFLLEGEHQFAPHLPVYAFLRRAEILLHLSEHKGDAPPKSLVYFYVDDVDAVAKEFNTPVEEQPWCREVSLTDPDGNRIRVGTRNRQE